MPGAVGKDEGITVMFRRTFLAGLAFAIGSIGLADAALAQKGNRPGSWELLGSQEVGFLTDKDVVRVGRKEGRFRAIKLRVRNNAVEMLDLKVVYANGNPDDIPVRNVIRAGGETRTIDLKGDTRAIQEVQLVYKSKPSFKGRAIVEVWGQH